jgi:mRNA interferase RelE/StbE
MERVSIQWTDTAKAGLAKTPLNVRRGILKKANLLREVDDPSKAHKRLTGTLCGYYRLTYARYRAIYTVEKEDLASGDILHKIIVQFVAVGIRKEGDKKDIYRLAQRLIELGIIPPDGETD